MSTQNLVVLISGSGTNLQAIIDACASGALDARLSLVVANRRAAYGLQRATEADIPTLYFPLKPYTTAGHSRAAYDADLAARIAPYTPDLVVLAGWMHILSPAFLGAFPGRVINLHPALPGQFAGVEAIERAFAAYQAGEITHSGCVVHYVVPALDAGPVIVQAEVPIRPEDTLDAFATRMHQTEHRIIVEAIQRHAVTVERG